MLNEQTLATLNALRLFGMAKSFSDKISHPHTADLSHQEFFGLIVRMKKPTAKIFGSNACSITPSSSSRPPSKTSITNIPEA